MVFSIFRQRRLDREEYFEILAEYFFVLLPFVVSAIFSARRGDVNGFFGQSEWSMAATILWGQVIIKLIQVGKSSCVKNNRAHTVLVTVFLIFLLVPSALLLFFVIDSGSSGPSLWLVGFQVVDFLFASFMYFVICKVCLFYARFNA